MVVDEVMGYAQAPCVTWVSTQVTIPAPSDVVGMPGKGTRGSRSLNALCVRGVARFTTVLMAALQGSLLFIRAFRGEYRATEIHVAQRIRFRRQTEALG